MDELFTFAVGHRIKLNLKLGDEPRKTYELTVASVDPSKNLIVFDADDSRTVVAEAEEGQIDIAWRMRSIDDGPPVAFGTIQDVTPPSGLIPFVPRPESIPPFAEPLRSANTHVKMSDDAHKETRDQIYHMRAALRALIQWAEETERKLTNGTD